jgi:hypothetical protein
MLEGAPDLPLEQTVVSSRAARELSSGQIAVSLSTLVELSRVDKQQWISFIKELGFPIEVRARDASRDILGKLLTYLETNESAREQLKTKASAKGAQASPELMKALSSLLREPK